MVKFPVLVELRFDVKGEVNAYVSYQPKPHEKIILPKSWSLLILWLCDCGDNDCKSCCMSLARAT